MSIFLVISIDFHSDKMSPVRAFSKNEDATSHAFWLMNNLSNGLIYAVEEVEYVD